MAREPAKTAKAPAAKRSEFKYPSEDEYLVRRLGSAVLSQWATLAPELKEQLLQSAVEVWDREYGVPQLRQKLDVFVKRHPSRLG